MNHSSHRLLTTLRGKVKPVYNHSPDEEKTTFFQSILFLNMFCVQYFYVPAEYKCVLLKICLYYKDIHIDAWHFHIDVVINYQLDEINFLLVRLHSISCSHHVVILLMNMVLRSTQTLRVYRKLIFKCKDFDWNIIWGGKS
jgi:hypothetical protein